MECRCYCCVTPRWVWLCLRVPVRNTSASKSCAWDPISSSKFASPSRSLGREFNFVSLQPQGRRQEQPARSAAAAGRSRPQQGSARQGSGASSHGTAVYLSSGAGCGSGSGSGCAVGVGLALGVLWCGCGGLAARTDPAALRGTQLRTRCRPGVTLPASPWHDVYAALRTTKLPCSCARIKQFHTTWKCLDFCVYREGSGQWLRKTSKKCGSRPRPGDRSYRVLAACSGLSKTEALKWPQVLPGVGFASSECLTI